MDRISVLKKHLFVLLILGLLLFLYDVGIGCPFLYSTGIPCPACGSTRAILALFRLNFGAYFSYQPMALPLLVATVLAFHVTKFKNKSVVISFIVLVSVVNTILYLMRLL
ncbi:MAG: DUF2752 domain-containing protein [Clostridia bacterium]|nr:DUF2752 domain-containing protein [Clostridia bacterium]